MKAEDIEQSIKEIMLWESLQSNRREVAKVIHELKVKVSSLQSQLKEERYCTCKHETKMVNPETIWVCSTCKKEVE